MVLGGGSGGCRRLRVGSSALCGTADVVSDASLGWDWWHGRDDVRGGGGGGCRRRGLGSGVSRGDSSVGRGVGNLCATGDDVLVDVGTEVYFGTRFIVDVDNGDFSGVVVVGRNGEKM